LGGRNNTGKKKALVSAALATGKESLKETVAITEATGAEKKAARTERSEMEAYEENAKEKEIKSNVAFAAEKRSQQQRRKKKRRGCEGYATRKKQRLLKHDPLGRSAGERRDTRKRVCLSTANEERTAAGETLCEKGKKEKKRGSCGTEDSERHL